MLRLLIGYYVIGGCVIWIAQWVSNLLVTSGTKSLQLKLPSMSEEAKNRATEGYCRRNGLIRITIRVLVLIILGFFALGNSVVAGGWWWTFWFLFAFYLIAGLFALPLDFVSVTNPSAVRQTLEQKD
jgi:hypothetical protein